MSVLYSFLDPLVIIVLCSYNKATQIKDKQDHYCSLATSGQWAGLGDFPEDLQWEALVDVVRGRVKVKPLILNLFLSLTIGVKVNAHCYEAVDLDALVRVSVFPWMIVTSHQQLDLIAFQ